MDGGLQWMRRLAEVNQRRLRDMKAQGMEEFAQVIPDPLSRLTAGGRLAAPGLQPAGASNGTFHGLKTEICTLKTAGPVTNLDLCIALRMEQDGSASEWEDQLAKNSPTGPEPRRFVGLVAGILEP